MERSTSSYTDNTDSSASAPNSSFLSIEALQPYPSSGSSQPFTPTEPVPDDVNGELVNFAGLDLTGLEGTELQGLGYDPRWNANISQGDYQLFQSTLPPGGDNGFGDSFDNSFPLQTFPHQPQPLAADWSNANPIVDHSPSGDFTPNLMYPTLTPLDFSYNHNTLPNTYGTDDGSSSQPGTGLISPQSFFPPAFVNPAEYHGDQTYHYPIQPYHNPQPVYGQAVYQAQSYEHMPVPPSTSHALPPLYNHALPSSVPLSRANSMSSVDKVRTKTCLTKEDRQAIFEMSKEPNMRQQDVALKYKIDRSTVSKIVTDCKKTELKRRNGEEEKPVPKQSKSGVARFPEVDTAVGRHVDALVAQGLIPNPDELQTVALNAAVQAGHTEFKASAKWVDNFYKRRAAEGKPGVPSAKIATPPTPLAPIVAHPSALERIAPVVKALPLNKSFSATSLTELAGPSHARQRSQSSPQKAGPVPVHQQPLPIRQSSLASVPRPTLTRSNSMGVSSRNGRGHRSRASITSPPIHFPSIHSPSSSLARSAFALGESLAPVQEDAPISMTSRSRHAYTRSDGLGLGSWASMPPSMMGYAPYHPGPPYGAPQAPPNGVNGTPPNDFGPPPGAGPPGSKRARR